MFEHLDTLDVHPVIHPAHLELPSISHGTSCCPTDTFNKIMISYRFDVTA